MMFRLVTGKAIDGNDVTIDIGMQISPTAFQLFKHPSLGVSTLDQWKNLFRLYGTRDVYEYVITPQGLKQADVPNGDIIPAFHLIAMLKDGYVKEVDGNTIRYVRQRGKIVDENNKTYTAEEMTAIVEKGYNLK